MWPGSAVARAYIFVVPGMENLKLTSLHWLGLHVVSDHTVCRTSVARAPCGSVLERRSGGGALRGGDEGGPGTCSQRPGDEQRGERGGRQLKLRGLRPVLAPCLGRPRWCSERRSPVAWERVIFTDWNEARFARWQLSCRCPLLRGADIPNRRGFGCLKRSTVTLRGGDGFHRAALAKRQNTHVQCIQPIIQRKQPRTTSTIPLSGLISPEVPGV